MSAFIHENQKDRFINHLFDWNESYCPGYNKYSINVYNLDEIILRLDYELISINTLKKSRADENVTSYRNILLEFDKHKISRQKLFIELNKIPYSTLVYSGGKSLHCLIMLDKCVGKDRYKELVKQIYFLLDPKDKWLDKTCGNPSRFTRVPGVLRQSTGVMQELIGDINPKISEGELLAWMHKHKNYPKLMKQIRETELLNKDRTAKRIVRANQPNFIDKGTESRFNFLTRRAESFFTYGPDKGKSWRVEALFSCCDAARCGYDIDEIYDLLLSVDGYLEKDSIQIPRDAYEMVDKSGQIGINLIL